MSKQAHNSPGQNLLAVLLEDYFHVGAFHQLIQSGQWYRFESRYEQNTLATLDLLDRFQTKATFFVLGWIADQNPEIVREVARRGHEIASRGYYNRSIHQMTPAEFREDLARTREALERAGGGRVIGYRAATPWRLHKDRWALEILAEEGYDYDTSVVPLSRMPRPEPAECSAQELKFGDRAIWEFPMTTANVLGWRVPISGGNYFRQFPHRVMKRAVSRWHDQHDAPFVMYFHVWELDRQQPRISGASSLARIRHYRNLGKMSWVMEDYLNMYRFTPFASYPGLAGADSPEARPESCACLVKEQSPIAISTPRPQVEENEETIHVPLRSPAPVAATPVQDKKPVTIVIPCYNEELILPYLDNTLRSVEAELSVGHQLNFVFVDDCSTDGTWDSLQRIFGPRPNFRITRHTHNRGVAAAIMTGIRHAETEVVCSMDCDCTYDPHELKNMIPLLADGVDLVTASPYHPQGQVRNVPPWRLTLSKGASLLYRQVLHQTLATYTSCFRVYRRGAVRDLKLREDGFLGVAEMLGRLDLRGSKIVEYPATLEVRLFGRSKMKLVKTIIGHLKLLARLLAMRVSNSEEMKAPVTTQTLTSPRSGPAPAAGYQTLPVTTKKD
ncbi:MAG TPA: glycosyltransferase [Blastocatellia bacterium]|nr:glycosyltransferase [Blastocatellia bacterium]